MIQNVILKQYGTVREYELECADAVLSNFQNVTTGTRQDANGVYWLINTGGTTQGASKITVNMTSATTNMYDISDVGDILSHFGIPVGHYAHQIDDYLGGSVTDNIGLNLVGPDQTAQYPYIRLSRNYSGNTGYYVNRRDYNIQILGNGSPTAVYQSYFYNQSPQYARNLYGGIIVYETATGFVYGTYAIQIDLYSDKSRIDMTFEWNTSVTDQTFAPTEGHPGDKGFQPTSVYTNPTEKPGVGGRGESNKKNPTYDSDTVTQPGAPDESEASAIGSGFITAYKITEANLQNVGACMWGTTLEGFIGGLFVNPLDYIISLSVFPYKPDVSTLTPIKMGRYLCQDTGANGLGFNANGFPLSAQYKVVDMGTIKIPENFGNFLDYSQTTVELYLPFIGLVNIDVSECMGGTINVQYTIDFFTGQCVANVLCERSLPLASNKFIPNRAQHSFQGNCSVQIPLSREDYGSLIGNVINGTMQAITNPVQGFAGIAVDAVAGGFRPNVSSKGNIVANAGFCSVLYPYVRITRPIPSEPESYQEVLGYPSYINTTLSQCDDLCVCESIDLKGISGATESELNRIRQACVEGVYV